MLNILVVENDLINKVSSFLMNNEKYPVNKLIVVDDFEKLLFKNTFDIDYVIAHSSDLVKNDFLLVDQIAQKGLSHRLVIIGQIRQSEKLSYIISKGIFAYLVETEDLFDRLDEILNVRIVEKVKEASICEMLNDGSLVKRVRQALEKGDSRLLQKSFASVSKLLPAPLSLLRGYFLLIMRTVLEFAEEKGVRHIEKKELMAELMSYSDFDELMSGAMKKVNGIIHLIEVNKKNQNKMVAEYIKDYVTENYMKQDTNAGNIAERFGVSGSYIGTLFREQEKTTITKYITQLRIMKAEELLKGTKLQIQAISKKVGYSDQNYFARIFKKHTGLTPGEYRQKSSHY